MTGPAPVGRFDSTFYRGPITSGKRDNASVVSQAISLPFQGVGLDMLPGKNKTYTGYASSIVSQQPPSEIDGPTNGHRGMGYSQYDRLPEASGQMRRRLSAGSVTPSDAPTASMYAFNYKAGDDDAQSSVAPSQAGVTDF